MSETIEASSEPVARLPEDERTYFLKRADDHRQLAEKAEESGSRMIHLRIQRLYEERASAIRMVVND